MKSHTVQYYNFTEDLQPEILKNLNELLVAQGIEPLTHLHGGSFKDGKWVSILDSNDYRNYWHVYVDLWGDGIRNDSYESMYFPCDDSDEEWQYYYDKADKFGQDRYPRSDSLWARDLVTAVRKMFRDHNLFSEDAIVIKWSW